MLSPSNRMSKWKRAGLAAAMAAGVLCVPLGAHVTLRPAQPLQPGGYATVNLTVPTERPVATVEVTLEVPDAFLNAGGRLSRVEFPPGWQVTFERQDKPGDVFQKEMAERGEPAGGQSPEDQAEQQAMNEQRKQWIKRVTFSGGSIPADGFKNFLLSLQMPEQPGSFRFPATQKYEDGKEVGWTELVEGAERPAPSLVIEARREDAAASSSRLGEYALHTLAGVVILLAGWLIGRGGAKRA